MKGIVAAIVAGCLLAPVAALAHGVTAPGSFPYSVTFGEERARTAA